MPLASVGIPFEMGVLAAAFTAIGGVIVGARLFRLHDPVFSVEGIESASVSRHWLRVGPGLAGEERLAEDLSATNPLRTVAGSEATR